jgi:hypothetical protein
MAEVPKDMTRGTFLGSTIAIPAFVAMTNAAALADSQKASQASVHYQSTPNGSKQCSGCKFFIAGSDANSSGTCQLVDGSISPHGYCDSYSAK